MPSSAKPRYQIVADQLRRDIEKGRYRVGTLLPTELQICETYEISRHTAREALRVLTNDRMIERRQGSGTVVTASTRQRHAHGISPAHDWLQYTSGTRLSIRDTKEIIADDNLGTLVGCAPGTALVHLHGVRTEIKSGATFCISDIYFIADNHPAANRLLDAGSHTSVLVNQLVAAHADMVEQHISATTLPPAIATALGVHRSGACLQILRRHFDAAGNLILVTVNLHAGRDYAYVMTLRQGRH